MFLRLVALAAISALFCVVNADLKVLSPGGPNLWWVAKSQNTIVWTCKDTPASTYTILLANKDPKILTAPLAVVAIINNFDCSKTITPDQASQTPATGYTLLMADPLNSTHVFATSDEFELKAFGSAYPDTSATPGGASSATATATDSSATPTKSGSSAVVLEASSFLAGAVAVAVLGLTA